LQLVNTTGRNWGRFSLFSSHPEKLLFVDLNYLSSAFRANLFEALQSGISQAQLAAARQEVEKPDDAASAATA
jgi:hypothetical protein